MDIICIISIVLLVIILLILFFKKDTKEKLVDENVLYDFGNNKSTHHLPYVYGKELFSIFYNNQLYVYCDMIMTYNYIYYYGKKSSELINNLDCVLSINNNNIEIIGIIPKHIMIYKILMLFEHIYRLDNEYALDLFNKNIFLYNIYQNYKTDNIKVIYVNDQILDIDPNLNLNITQTNQLLPSKINKYAWYNITKYKIGKYILDIYKEEKVNIDFIDTNRKKIYENFNSLIFNNDFYYRKNDTKNISFNIHRIWLTDINNPREIDTESLTNIINTYNIYDNSYYPWKTILWLNTDKISNTINYLKEKCPNIDIRIITDNELKFARKIYDSFMKDNLYANASDILRLNIIYIYGGLYLDLSIILTKDISDLYIESDRVFYYDKESDIDISIQSCKYKMNDYMYLEYLTFLENEGWKKYNYVPSVYQIIFTGREYIEFILETRFYNSIVLLLYDDFCIKRKSLKSWFNKWIKKKTDLWKL